MGEIKSLIRQEENRQAETLMMIPSENYTYPEVREAVGSVLMHKYSEGYANRRYYQGNKYVDEIELVAIENAKKLFNTPHANVQPYSGSPANAAIYMALAEPGDTIMGMQLVVGGHLTHGHPDITFSGKYYRSVQFGVGMDGRIDYEEVSKLANKERPKVLMVGTTAYPFAFDWKKFAEIAESVGAYLVADISHVSGLVVSGVYPSPVDYAHAIMSTTHKTLRGPKGAIILVTDRGLKKDKDMATKIDRAVFPGMQGGPHNNATAGIAIALEKANTPEFRKYGKQIVRNANVLAKELIKSGFTLVGGGTESHLIVVDLSSRKLSGNVVAEALEVAGIVVNRNTIPNETGSPFYPSGIRLGTPAITVRGMKEKEMKMITTWITKVVDYIEGDKLPDSKKERKVFMEAFRKRITKDEYLLSVAKEVKTLCKEYPID